MSSAITWITSGSASSDADAQIAIPHRFKVTIGRYSLGGWQKVTGMMFDCKPVSITQAGFNTYNAQLLGVPTWSPIVLWRVVIGDEWHDTYEYLMEAMTTPETLHNKGAAKDLGQTLTIQYNNAWDEKVRSIEFYNARPSKWQGPDLDASKGATAAAVEQLTLIHDGFFPDGHRFESGT